MKRLAFLMLTKIPVILDTDILTMRPSIGRETLDFNVFLKYDIAIVILKMNNYNIKQKLLIIMKKVKICLITEIRVVII